MQIAQCDSRVVDFWLDPATDAQGQLRITTPWLKPGAYTVDLSIFTGGRSTDIWEQACRFQVLPVTPYPFPTTPDAHRPWRRLPALRVSRRAEGDRAGHAHAPSSPRRVGSRSPGLSELWEGREVAYRFGARDVTLRYRQTLLGVVWVILQPLLTAAIFTLVLHNVAHLKTPGMTAPTSCSSSSGCSAGTCSTASSPGPSNRSWPTATWSPRSSSPACWCPWPPSTPTIVDFGVTTVFLFILMALYRSGPGWALVLAPVWAAHDHPVGQWGRGGHRRAHRSATGT